jgi:hypothetical protein
LAQPEITQEPDPETQQAFDHLFGSSGTERSRPWRRDTKTGDPVYDEDWDDGPDRAVFDLAQRHLTPEQVEALPAPQWLLDGWLVRNTLALLWGEWNAGKSFLALTWAGFIGSPQCAHWLNCPLQRAKVLYVAGEGVAGLGPRIKAFKTGHNLPDMAGVGFIHGRINLLDPAQMLALARLCADVGYELIVWDTIARMLPGADENSSKEMSLVVDALDQLRSEVGTGSLALHHATKDGGAARGISPYLGACDTELKLIADEQAITLTCLQQRDADRPDPLNLWREPVPKTGSATIVDGTGKKQVTRSPGEQRVLDIFQNLPKGSYSVKEIDAKNVSSTSSTERALFRLWTQGFLVRSPQGNGYRYALP